MSPRDSKPDARTPRPAWGGPAYILLLVAAFLAVNYVFFRASAPESVPYSRFLESLEAGRVTSVSVAADYVAWREGPGEERVNLRASRVPGVDDAALLERLERAGVEVRGIPADSFWITMLSWSLPLLLLMAVWIWMTRRMRGQAEFLSFGRSRARLWEEGSTRVTFKEVAGVEEAVTELREVVDFLKQPEKYTRLGARIPKGVLLVGPPGTGKTLLARATAGEASVPFFSISGAEFVELFVGVGAARARDLFLQARKKAPCIVFIDEIDALGRSRAGARAPVTNEEREQTLNQLLVEIDGFESTAGVILMAATNRPDLLDPALLRPGRFDRQVVVDKPDLNGREAILKVHARNVRLAPEVALRVLAARTPGFAGAELANVINEAALLAVRRGQEAVTMAELEEAVDRVMAGLERRSRALSPKEREIVAHHEMGHALMGMLLPHADPVHRVSIVPRGTAALGVTIQTPLEDRYLLTRAELFDRMTVILGGRAAEELVFGDVSTGGADDLQQATALARHMVTCFGMAPGLGPTALEELDRAYPDGALLPGLRTYSEETARRIDAEVRGLVDAGYARATALLREHRKVLLSFADELLRREVMDGRELSERLAALGIRRIAPEEAGVPLDGAALPSPGDGAGAVGSPAPPVRP